MSILYLFYLRFVAWFRKLEAQAELMGNLGFVDEFGQAYHAPGRTPWPKHVEWIMCPECGTEQEATVETMPCYPGYGSYVHECEYCEYVIMESDWIKIDPPQEKAG